MAGAPSSRRGVLQASLALLLAPTAALAGTPGWRAKVDALCSAVVESGRTAGLAIAVNRDGETIFAEGYGRADLENDVAMTPEAVCRIGSLTKQFTAAIVIELAQQGRLSLDDKLARFLPAFPRAAQISVLQLLNHTSGMGDYTGQPSFLADARKDYTTQELTDLCAGYAEPFAAAPGTAFDYCNSGYVVLGAIIETVTGRPLAEAYAALFARLGLKDTAWDDNRTIVPRRARGYDPASRSGGAFVNTGYLSMTFPGAGGALRSTVGDLVAWQDALFGGRVLSRDGLKQMLTPARLADGRLASAAPLNPPRKGDPRSSTPDYGCGVYVGAFDGRRRVFHGGSIFGFKAQLQGFPEERLSIAMLANTSGGLNRGEELDVAAALA